MQVSPKAVANFCRKEQTRATIARYLDKYCDKYFVSFDFTSFRALHVTDKVCVKTIVLYFFLQLFLLKFTSLYSVSYISFLHPYI